MKRIFFILCLVGITMPICEAEERPWFIHIAGGISVQNFHSGFIDEEVSTVEDALGDLSERGWFGEVGIYGGFSGRNDLFAGIAFSTVEFSFAKKGSSDTELEGFSVYGMGGTFLNLGILKFFNSQDKTGWYARGVLSLGLQNKITNHVDDDSESQNGYGMQFGTGHSWGSKDVSQRFLTELLLRTGFTPDSNSTQICLCIGVFL